MHHHSSLALAALVAFVVPALAQDMERPSPSPKLKAFEPFTGSWTGKGTVTPQEGADPMPWTATTVMKPVLDGFFFQDDSKIEMPGMPTPLGMRTVYGWDAENERYVAYGVGNTGEGEMATVHFPDPRTMVMGSAGLRMGQYTVSRAVWKIDGDTSTFVSERANDAGDWYVEVEGTFERGDATAPASVQVVDASFMDVPVHEQTSRLADALSGKYAIQGSMTIAPGMPETKIRGTEAIGPAFGGHVVFSRVEGFAEGDDHPYVGETYMTWNAVDQSYDLVMFDNMGMVGAGQLRFVDDATLVGVFAGPMMGTPSVQRSVTRIGENGVTGAVSHSIVGAHEPMKSFEAKYTRK